MTPPSTAEAAGWRHVAEYYLGEACESMTPSEARREAMRRTREEGRKETIAAEVREAVIARSKESDPSEVTLAWADELAEAHIELADYQSRLGKEQTARHAMRVENARLREALAMFKAGDDAVFGVGHTERSVVAGAALAARAREARLRDAVSQVAAQLRSRDRGTHRGLQWAYDAAGALEAALAPPKRRMTDEELEATLARARAALATPDAKEEFARMADAIGDLPTSMLAASDAGGTVDDLRAQLAAAIKERDEARAKPQQDWNALRREFQREFDADLARAKEEFSAQLAAVTKERDDARAEVAGYHQAADDWRKEYDAAIARAEAAERVVGRIRFGGRW